MKNRLMGLLALVLCVMMTVVPFAGAMAEVEAYLKYVVNDDLDVLPGDRMVGEVELSYYYSDSLTDSATYPVYTLRVTSDGANSDVKFGGAEPDNYEGFFTLSSSKKVTRVDLTTGGNGYDSLMTMITPLATAQEYTDGNTTVIISEGLQTPLYPNTASEVQRAFQNADNRQMKFYEITAYNTLITDDNNNPLVLRPVQSSTMIKLEAPADLAVGDAYTLYHFEYAKDAKGSVATVTSGTLGEDRIITFTVGSFSPFALAYGEERTAAGSVPSTGDNSQLMLWSALMMLSLAGMMAIRRRKRA